MQCSRTTARLQLILLSLAVSVTAAAAATAAFPARPSGGSHLWHLPQAPPPDAETEPTVDWETLESADWPLNPTAELRGRADDGHARRARRTASAGGKSDPGPAVPLFCVLVSWRGGRWGEDARSNKTLAALRAAAVQYEAPVAKGGTGRRAPVAFVPCVAPLPRFGNKTYAAGFIRGLAEANPRLLGIVSTGYSHTPLIAGQFGWTGLALLAPRTIDAGLFDRAAVGQSALHLQASLESDVNVLLQFGLHSKLRCRRWLVSYYVGGGLSQKPQADAWVAVLHRLGLPPPVVVSVHFGQSTSAVITAAALLAVRRPQCYVLPFLYGSVRSTVMRVSAEPRLFVTGETFFLVPSLSMTDVWSTSSSRKLFTDRLFVVSALPVLTDTRFSLRASVIDAYMKFMVQSPKRHWGLVRSRWFSSEHYHTYIMGRLLLESAARVDPSAMTTGAYGEGDIDRRRFLQDMRRQGATVAVDDVVLGPTAFGGCVGRQTAATGPCWCNSAAKRMIVSTPALANGYPRPVERSAEHHEPAGLGRIPLDSCGMPAAAITPTTAVLFLRHPPVVSAGSGGLGGAAAEAAGAEGADLEAALRAAAVDELNRRRAAGQHDEHDAAPVVRDLPRGAGLHGEVHQLVTDRYQAAIIVAPRRQWAALATPSTPASPAEIGGDSDAVAVDERPSAGGRPPAALRPVTVLGALPPLPVVVLGELSAKWLLEDPVYVPASRPDATSIPDGAGSHDSETDGGRSAAASSASALNDDAAANASEEASATRTLLASRTLSPSRSPLGADSGTIVPWNDRVIDFFPVMADVIHVAASFAAAAGGIDLEGVTTQPGMLPPEALGRVGSRQGAVGGGGSAETSLEAGAAPDSFSQAPATGLDDAAGETAQFFDFYSPSAGPGVPRGTASGRSSPPLLVFAEDRDAAALALRSAHTFGVDPALIRVSPAIGAGGLAESLPLEELPPALGTAVAASRLLRRPRDPIVSTEAVSDSDSVAATVSGAGPSSPAPAVVIMVVSQTAERLTAAVRLGEALPGAAVVLAANEFTLDRVRQQFPAPSTAGPAAGAGSASGGVATPAESAASSPNSGAWGTSGAAAGSQPVAAGANLMARNVFFASGLAGYRSSSAPAAAAAPVEAPLAPPIPTAAAQYGAALGALAGRTVNGAYRSRLHPRGRIVSDNEALEWLFTAGTIRVGTVAVGPLYRELCNPRAAGSESATRGDHDHLDGKPNPVFGSSGVNGDLSVATSDSDASGGSGFETAAPTTAKSSKGYTPLPVGTPSPLLPWRTPKTARCQCKKALNRFHILRLADVRADPVHHLELTAGTCGVSYRPLPVSTPKVPPSGGLARQFLTTVLPFGAALVAIVAASAVVVFVSRRLASNTRDNRNAPRDETVPFAVVFTDIQSSTKLWANFPTKMGPAIDQHHAIMREMIAEHCGYEVKTIGDSFMVAFKDPVDAVSFSIAVQMRLRDHQWGTRAFDDLYFAAEEEAGLQFAEAEETQQPDAAPTGFHLGGISVISSSQQPSEQLDHSGHDASASVSAPVPPAIDPQGANARSPASRDRLSGSLEGTAVIRPPRGRQPSPPPPLMSFPSCRQARPPLNQPRGSTIMSTVTSSLLGVVGCAGGSMRMTSVRSSRYLVTGTPPPVSDGSGGASVRVARGQQLPAILVDPGTPAADYAPIVAASERSSLCRMPAEQHEAAALLSDSGGDDDCDETALVAGSFARLGGLCGAAAVQLTAGGKSTVTQQPAPRSWPRGGRCVVTSQLPLVGLGSPQSSIAGTARAGTAGGLRDRLSSFVASVVDLSAPGDGWAVKDGRQLWHGIRVRIGVHFGQGDIRRHPQTGGMDYDGPAVRVAAQVESMAHGGQVAITEAVYDALLQAKGAADKDGAACRAVAADLLAASSVVQLGAYQLPVAAGPLELFQILPTALAARRFPPLRDGAAALPLRCGADGGGSQTPTASATSAPSGPNSARSDARPAGARGDVSGLEAVVTQRHSRPSGGFQRMCCIPPSHSSMSGSEHQPSEKSDQPALSSARSSRPKRPPTPLMTARSAGGGSGFAGRFASQSHLSARPLQLGSCRNHGVWRADCPMEDSGSVFRVDGGSPRTIPLRRSCPDTMAMVALLHDVTRRERQRAVAAIGGRQHRRTFDMGALPSAGFAAPLRLDAITITVFAAWRTALRVDSAESAAKTVAQLCHGWRVAANGEDPVSREGLGDARFAAAGSMPLACTRQLMKVAVRVAAGIDAQELSDAYL